MLFIVSSLGMDFGRSPRPVSPDYAPPFVYPGVIRRVEFNLPPISHAMAQAILGAEAVQAMSRQ